ncbi:MAG: efflux RND transporter periplasmic adaptor subunit [Phycisphaerales bacterium]|nr:efflux RND transporter periplasmic adaptor subunit [Phycisphaerales bacterium]
MESVTEEHALTPTAGETRDVSGELRGFLHDLLHLQCRLVSGECGIAFLTPTATRAGGAAATWVSPSVRGDPRALLAPAVVKRLERIAEQARGEDARRSLAPGVVESVTIEGSTSSAGIYSASATHRAIAVPLSAEGRIEGACVVLTRVGEGPGDDEARLRMALAGTRFEAFLWREHALGESVKKARLRETLELLDASMRAESAGSMGAVLCHEIARRFGCARVSIGLVRGDRVHLHAVSGADDLDRRGAAAEAIEGAMDECAQQDAEVLVPQDELTRADPMLRRVVRAHDELSRTFGPSAILSLPLRVEGDLVGVMTLERSAHEPFPEGAVSLLRLVGEFVGPAVWTRRMADRGIAQVARDRAMEVARAAVGPRHTALKLVLGSIGALLIASAVMPIPDRVVSQAKVQADASRTIVPAFAGYIERVEVRPGDAVEEGQVLAALSTSELELRLAEAGARFASLEAQVDAAQGENKAGEARRLRAEMAQVEAERALLDEQIAHAEVRSPIRGLVGRGDIEDVVGARVDPSQPLMEVIGTGRRAVAMVDERDIARVEIGARCVLVSKGRTGQRVAARVVRIDPVAEETRTGNAYGVELELEDAADAPAWLSPGMTGVARIESGWTTPLARLLRPAIDELRLRWWW